MERYTFPHFLFYLCIVSKRIHIFAWPLCFHGCGADILKDVFERVLLNSKFSQNLWKREDCATGRPHCMYLYPGHAVCGMSG